MACCIGMNTVNKPIRMICGEGMEIDDFDTFFFRHLSDDGRNFLVEDI